MRKIIIASVSGLLGLTIALSGVTSAFADDGDGDAADGISAPGTLPDGSADDAAAALAKTQAATATWTALESEYPGLNQDQTGATPALDVPAKSLNVTQYDQAKGVYCGPASAEALLKYKHPSDSAYNGASLSQATLADSTYLQTDADGGTPWRHGRMKTTLNRWLGKNWYFSDASPSGNDFVGHVYYDIFDGYPVQADAVEIAGHKHYNNHPSNLTIGHWIDAYGFTTNVASTRFEDPSHSSHVSWGSKPAEYFTYNTKNFATDFLQDNGVVW